MEHDLIIRRFADLDPSPWKNGNGETREIASGGGPGHEWRASLATLSRSAQFSAFPGKRRIFTNVGDAPLTLSFEEENKSIKPNQPFPFSGELTPYSRLDAPSSAFNMIFDSQEHGIIVTAGIHDKVEHGYWLLFALEAGILKSGEPFDRFDTIFSRTQQSAVLFQAPLHALLVTLPE